VCVCVDLRVCERMRVYVDVVARPVVSSMRCSVITMWGLYSLHLLQEHLVGLHAQQAGM
jgi:hypothetical protein